MIVARIAYRTNDTRVTGKVKDNRFVVEILIKGKWTTEVMIRSAATALNLPAPGDRFNALGTKRCREGASYQPTCARYDSPVEPSLRNGAIKRPRHDIHGVSHSTS
jgi:hypothetical protein